MSDDGEDNTTSPEQRASGRARPSLAGKAGRSAACGYHAPGRSAGKAARLMVMSCGGGEGGRPTCQLPATRGLVEEPVAAHAAGNAVADRRSLPAGLGKTQRPVDRGAGGNRCQSALPCGTRRLLPTRPRRDAIRCGWTLPCQWFGQLDDSDWSRRDNTRTGVWIGGCKGERDEQGDEDRVGRRRRGVDAGGPAPRLSFDRRPTAGWWVDTFLRAVWPRF